MTSRERTELTDRQARVAEIKRTQKRSERKRTVLVALALQHADANDRAFIATRLGDPGLTPDDVERLRGILLGSGAVAGVEALIASLRAEAMAALGTIDGTSDGAEMMRRLAQALVDRSA